MQDFLDSPALLVDGTEAIGPKATLVKRDAEQCLQSLGEVAELKAEVRVGMRALDK